jgi:hypothetical protein
MGYNGVQGGIANAVEKKTPQQQTRHQGNSDRPQTGVSNNAAATTGPNLQTNNSSQSNQTPTQPTEKT